MPANLTQPYRNAEAAFRKATTPEEELDCLQWMLREVPKHKGTDKLQAELKQKISKARKELEAARQSPKAAGLRIPRQGAGRVIVTGGPNAGKSQFIDTVTRAEPEVAPYPFTTRVPAPAMMPWEDVMIQLIDTPPITSDFLETNMQGLIRGADLVLLLVDLGSDDGIDQLQQVIDKMSATKTRFGTESYLDEEDIGRSYTTTLLVPNKIDVADADSRLEIMHELCPLPFAEFVVSAVEGTGIEPLQKSIFKTLDVVRVYTKLPTAKEPDYDKPFTLRRGSTLADVAQLIHKDVAQRLKSARVWGSEVHDGTVVKPDYVVHDKDVIEIHA